MLYIMFIIAIFCLACTTVFAIVMRLQSFWTVLLLDFVITATVLVAFSMLYDPGDNKGETILDALVIAVMVSLTFMLARYAGHLMASGIKSGGQDQAPQ